MKTLFLIPDLNKPGGVANYYNAIRSSMPADIHYFTRGSRNNAGKIKNAFTLVTDYFRLIFLIGSYDAVLINTSFARAGITRDAIFCFICRLFHKPYIIFFRGWEHGFEGRVTSGIYRLLFNSSFLKANKILVLASTFSKFIKDQGYKNKVIVETTIVEKSLYQDQDIEQLVQERMGTIPTLLFLSRLEKSKGIIECIEIHKRLARLGYKNKLLIAGSGNAENMLGDMAGTDITRLGYVSGKTKSAAYRQAHFYLFPSTHGEGMPNSVLEAMMFGLPVITTRIGGIRDFFNDSMGVSTELPDVDAYVEYIVKVLRKEIDPKALAISNNRYATEYFSQEVVAARLLKELNDLKQEMNVPPGKVKRPVNQSYDH